MADRTETDKRNGDGSDTSGAGTGGRRGRATDRAAAARADLARELAAAVRGEVSATAGDRALMTMDASNYRRVPDAVVAPRDAEDVAAALRVCRERGVPVVPRGGGTSIAGQATGTGVVLDFTRHMRRIVALDPEARTAVVQPGVVLDDLRDAAAPHGLTFGPDPSTHSRCTLGGMIGNNSCGSHSVAWGTTADNVHTLDLLTYGGEAVRAGRGTDPEGRPTGLPPRLRDGVQALVGRELALLRTGYPAGLPRRISGYALDALLPEAGTDLARALTGSEGTLGVVTEAAVRLVETPAARALAVLAYPDESAAAEAAHTLLPGSASKGFEWSGGGTQWSRPLTVEGMAADLVGKGAAGLPDGGAWLFVEMGGASRAEAAARAEALCRAATADGATGHALVADPAGQRALWRIREDASGTATRMPDGTEAWPGWEDCAVPPARLGPYLRDFRALLAQHGLRGTPYGHFGDGCIHVRIDFDLLTPPGIRRFRDFSTDLAALVVAHGGSLSGEHGDGQARAELLPAMYGDELVGLFGTFKDLWDPAGGLNPGMLVRPARLDDNLRFAPLPKGPVPVEFGYPHDHGDFPAAVSRCVGVAKCRTEKLGSGSSDVMCPSYRATGEERHSTRGRARLLHEMLAGEVITDGWRSPEVRDALDLCLSCKGCRSDCPVGVDMATYKAEFLHHHYAGRIRPAAHYAMGRLPQWLRAAAPAAPLLNALARTPLAAVAKRLAGIAPEREIPALAGETFRRWWWRRRAAGGAPTGGRTVVLWPDTFTDHLSPEVGRAAVRVLEAAGLRPLLPPTAPLAKRPSFPLPRLHRPGLCCGLTYVSTGQLTQARAVMRRTVEVLGPLVRPDRPLVVLEPSCAAALRTDLPELLSDDPRAARLAASVRTFAEVLEELAPDWTPPRLDRPVAGQTHCHQHAVLGDAADRRLRERAGLTGDLSGGCCGLAGNFGFERGHYDVSVACAEDQLLPAVREAPPHTEILADGFSCRTQLAQLGARRGRHLAEVLAEALDAGERGKGGAAGEGGGPPSP
ncbi:FAD-binding and (Fe-S)-binding domain-containing protein [Streptomyces yunnanensis]|uniref:FAD/FMN-containing dehydrogenase n=1 Tax=Streptomyces yunnanensis TaxID=156453 RepID=A0A9X8MYJ5_9ACTN|nr:FAD-binding and (Fe-S)-binding domain-containing protein [Streptomyces yunnanensis]SHM31966.1 FAD/FMN-containing dehydrogenase [Streptomyces yunnanensis]